MNNTAQVVTPIGGPGPAQTTKRHIPTPLEWERLAQFGRIMVRRHADDQAKREAQAHRELAQARRMAENLERAAREAKSRLERAERRYQSFINARERNRAMKDINNEGNIK